MRLLEAGVIVARTADDLTRYHGKLMIVDRRELYLLAFNLTSADIGRSRSFGVVTRSRGLVREAVRLFESDTERHLYEAGLDQFVVSPANARQQLSSFIAGAKKELLIYDPKVSDPPMIRLLQERARAGVQIRLIGRLARKCAGVTVRKLSQMRLHTRSMVRDGNLAFLGSQSLRAMELDGRREVGLIFRDANAVRGLMRIFQNDWTLAAQESAPLDKEAAPAAKVARKVAKAVARELPPVSPVLNGAVKEVVGEISGAGLNSQEVEETREGRCERCGEGSGPGSRRRSRPAESRGGAVTLLSARMCLRWPRRPVNQGATPRDFASCGVAGSSRRKCVPCPGALSTCTPPPLLRTNP